MRSNKYDDKNKLNDLTGSEWKFATKSVINKQYPINMQHKLRSEHGGQKPPELCADLIKIFTKKGMKVLDPFMGVGGTLLGASISNREALGIDLNQRWIDIYKEVVRLEKIKEQETECGDSLVVLDKIKNESFDFSNSDSNVRKYFDEHYDNYYRYADCFGTEYRTDGGAVPGVNAARNYLESETDDNYSIAFYVERYKTKLEGLGATISNARLLKHDELISLNNNSVQYYYDGQGDFWLGTTDEDGAIEYVYYNIIESALYGFDSAIAGIRPVLEIPTCSININ